jgi:hypothetical protein
MKRSRLHRREIGSNQYQTQERYFGLKSKTLRDVTVCLAFILGISLVGTEATANEPVELMTPLATRAFAMELTRPQLPVETKTDEQQEIANYICEVFGKDCDKAFAVLSCENPSLNPKAVNTAGNEPAGSRDIGVFQINEYWQRTQGKFLFNWKINVEIAHQLFEENGKSFKLWTCGRKLGV